MSHGGNKHGPHLVVGLALWCSLAGIFALSGVAHPAHEWRTIPLHGTFNVASTGPTDVVCPRGVPKSTAGGSVTPCFLVVGRAEVAGLGAVTERYAMAVLGSDTNCPKLKFTAVLTVAGKGTITAPAASKRCLLLPLGMNETTPFSISGGTGAYAGATGHGTVHQVNHGGNGGPVTDTWNGTLTLKG